MSVQVYFIEYIDFFQLIYTLEQKKLFNQSQYHNFETSFLEFNIQYRNFFQFFFNLPAALKIKIIQN